MKAMVLRELADLRQNPRPLALESVTDPVPADSEIVLEVSVCGVCHTELDEIEGRLPPKLPIILGHQVVGRVVERDDGASGLAIGDRAGVAWIYHACGVCKYCRHDAENLCPDFMATGRDADGGYAEYMSVPASFAHRIPDALDDVAAAPLMCAGAIGYRSLRLSGITDGERLGLTGFGASGHLVLKMVRHRFPNAQVYVFARAPEQREFALELGASWAGATEDPAPERLAAIIDTTPAWKPVVEALRNLEPGGRLVINAIRKERADQDYLGRLDYEEELWLEKEVKSVANVTRRDVREFLDLAADIGIQPDVEEYGLADANQALVDLRTGGGRGAKVLRIH